MEKTAAAYTPDHAIATYILRQQKGLPMKVASAFLDRIQQACQEISAASSQETLYASLIPALEKMFGCTGSAFMTIGRHGPDSPAFRIVTGTGRFAGMNGEILRDGEARCRLGTAMAQRANLHTQDAIAFHFPHPENLAVLVYFELQQALGEADIRLLSFFNFSVTSAILAHASSRLADRTNRTTVVALASLAEHKDAGTGEHIMRVAIMTDEIVHVLSELGHYQELITPEFEHLVSTASILHDVGKVSIPDSVLQKPARLNAQERRVIENHTVKGHEVLEKASRMLDGNNYLIKLASEIAICHHEHYNGLGYPARLAGQDIPLSARIVGVADVYDALISARPYKDEWSNEETIAYIKNQAGKQFDPLVVEAFLKVMEHRKEAALIQWTEDMSVQVPHLDEDHRSLIAFINQLASAEKIGNRRIVESVLDELVNYVSDHFRREELFLQEIGFADFADHQQHHKTFTERIREVRWQYLHGFHPRINQEILMYLRNWLRTHILVEDMNYAKLVCAQTRHAATLHLAGI